MATHSRGIIDRGPSLADTVAVRLREEIVSGRLRPGEKLPTEQQLSETYGVSRPTVREAVGRLKHDGLVITRQGAGAYVADPGAVSVFRLDIADFSNREEIRNIVELLMAIEASATEHAAVRRSDEDLKAIQAQLDAMQQAIDRGESGVDEDLAFHRAIIEATGNPFFRDMSDFLDRRVRNFIRTARANTARLEGLSQAVQVEHQAIFNAIVQRDAGAARGAAETHLKNAAQRLALYLEP
jgi:GntR family transcriptional regulator, transcriptional repressor for pyruvate dehydrogenase complex